MTIEFIDIDMPDEFVLECLTADGRWIDWGLYRAPRCHDESLDVGRSPSRTVAAYLAATNSS